MAGTPLEKFIQDPQPWGKLDDEAKAWFGPRSNVTSGAWGQHDGGAPCVAASLADDDGETAAATAPFDAPCCSAWPTRVDGSGLVAQLRAPTSKEVCECWSEGGADLGWGDFLPQRFDDVPMVMLTFLECATTEVRRVTLYHMTTV